MSDTPHFDNINRRCLTELDWPFGDAAFLYPDATKRIVQDEIIARWPTVHRGS